MERYKIIFVVQGWHLPWALLWGREVMLPLALSLLWERTWFCPQLWKLRGLCVFSWCKSDPLHPEWPELRGPQSWVSFLWSVFQCLYCLCSVELSSFQGFLLQFLSHLLLSPPSSASEQSPHGHSSWSYSLRAEKESLQGDCHHSLCLLGSEVAFFTVVNCSELWAETV